MKKKVLMVCCGGFENGGIQGVIMSIVRNLSDKYSFDAISFSPGEQHYSQEFLKYGNIYHFNRYSPKNTFTKIFKGFIEYQSLYIQSKIFFKEHNDYDIVHCHNYFNAAPIIKAAKESGIGIRISHSHNVEPVVKLKNPIGKCANKFKSIVLRKYSTEMIACSKAAGKYLFSDSQFKVINNAIDLQKFNPKNYNIQQNDDTIKFVHVGRYGYQKNQLFLLDVFREYLKLNNNATLDLVGFGIWTEKVKDKINQLNLSDKVSMLPCDSNIPEIYANSDIFIFPSTFEGLGISLIEAQAMGLKCYISEAVQPEANLGLCKKLELSWGAKKWADFINNDIRENGCSKKFVDLSAYDITKVKYQYLDIYTEK